MSRESVTNLLKRLKTVFDKYEVCYWLDAGTLLKAYRDSDIIPSSDLDFGTWQTEIDKVLLVCDELSNIKPKLVFYSGYGSQIVKPELLNLAFLMHIHSGWLPEYRGSTTLYYSWLKEGYCGASAILLRKEIDTGPIIARKRYPPPPGVDPDYVYDSVIRSDLLIFVLQEYSQHNKFINLLNQPLVGNNYYVIHPVLKHIALLMNESMHS